MTMIINNKEVINRMKFDRNDIKVIEINFKENNIDAFTKDCFADPRKWVANYNLTRERMRELEIVVNRQV